MAVARSKLVDLELTPWYHCLSKCVRGAGLLRFMRGWRKEWLEGRLAFLNGVFGIHVSAYAIMDNHLHLLLRVCADEVAGWSDEEVVRRWATLCEPRNGRREKVEVTAEWVRGQMERPGWVEKIRGRLINLGWFMKFLKEPLSRMANMEDGAEGAFWQARFKSIAVLDELALLKTQAYIDLNPFSAGLAPLPEQSEFTSLRARLDHCHQASVACGLDVADRGAAELGPLIDDMDERGWLLPLNDRREMGGTRPGVLAGYTLRAYLMLVDDMSRVLRHGKAHLTETVVHLLERLGTSASSWVESWLALFKDRRLYGVAYASDAGRLQLAASRRGCKRVVNLRAQARKTQK